MKPKEIRKCLDQLSAAKRELFEGKVIRSERLTGELGEYLAVLQLSGRLAAGTSNKGWDLLAEIDGKPNQRVQVKAHAKGERNLARWTQFTSIEAFDYLFIVVLSPAYHVRELYLVSSPDLQRGRLAKFDKKTKKWMVDWDVLKKDSKTVIPERGVKDCFGLAAGNVDQTLRRPPTALDDQPDPADDGLPPWELLSSPSAKSLYFAPTAWRPWNVVPAGIAAVPMMRGRFLVFEYRGPAMGGVPKITLRGRLPEILRGGLSANLSAAVNDFGWEIPGDQGWVAHTQGCAVWRADGGLPRYHRAPTYPPGGFLNDQAVFDWLVAWDRLIGPFAGQTSRLWSFISNVVP